MHNASVSDRQPLVSLLFIIIMVGTGFLLVGPAIGIGVASLFYGSDWVMTLRSNPDHSIYAPFMITQGIASFTGLILFPILYFRYLEHKSLKPLFTLKELWIFLLPLIMLIGVGFQVMITPVIEWNMTLQFPEYLKSFGDWARKQEDATMELTKVITSFQSQRELVIGIFVIAVIPGIGEELVFRGLIQNELRRSTGNAHVAIWVAAFLFSAIHMQFFGFLPRVLLGALFGYLYYWSGNLLIPMFAHFFHNGFTLLMLYLYQQGITALDMDSEEAAPWPWVITGLVTTFVLLLYFRKLYATKHSTQSS